jgi:UDP-glucuronate 4-epimerase
MQVLVTGAAGFIGFHVARALIARGDAVTGFDNVNAYYDVALKEARLAELAKAGGDWNFLRADLADRAAVDAAFAAPFDRVIHLAAQAGVRHSLEHPLDYVASNLLGFTHVLEACRRAGTPHLTFASTSSVYGANTRLPFTESQDVGHPLQFYAATKRANELMAHAYAHLYQLPCTGLRFFTVYGPWGRPDMAPMIFARAISEGTPLRASDLVAAPDPDWDPADPDPGSSAAPFRLYNIGNNAPVELADFVAALERELGRKAVVELAPPQPGDVPDTWADSARLTAATGWRPETSVAEGVRRFVAWYRAYHGAQ